jgi:hypothetical protein
MSLETPKKPLTHKILQYLLEIDSIDEDQVIITDFLKQRWRKDTNEDWNDIDRIKRALERLLINNLITLSFDPDRNRLNEDKIHPTTGEKYRCTLDNTNIQAGLTQDGYDRIVEVLRLEKQDEINQSLKDSGDSAIITNTSVRRLNRFLKWANIGALAIAAATGVFIALTFLKDDGKDLRPIYTQLESIARSQDSMRLIQREIQTSLQKALSSPSKRR